MSKSKKIPLREIVRRTAATVPEFADALAEEEEHLTFCREMRSDLKRLRESMGITQSELAAKMEMSQSAVSRIENGGGDVGLITLRRYAAALGMQPVVSFTLSSQSYSRPEAIEPIVKALQNFARVRDAEAGEMRTGVRTRLSAIDEADVVFVRDADSLGGLEVDSADYRGVIYGSSYVSRKDAAVAQSAIVNVVETYSLFPFVSDFMSIHSAPTDMEAGKATKVGVKATIKVDMNAGTKAGKAEKGGTPE